jgi:hypothetical protein
MDALRLPGRRSDLPKVRFSHRTAPSQHRRHSHYLSIRMRSHPREGAILSHFHLWRRRNEPVEKGNNSRFPRRMPEDALIEVNSWLLSPLGPTAYALGFVAEIISWTEPPHAAARSPRSSRGAGGPSGVVDCADFGEGVAEKKMANEVPARARCVKDTIIPCAGVRSCLATAALAIKNDRMLRT